MRFVLMEEIAVSWRGSPVPAYDNELYFAGILRIRNKAVGRGTRFTSLRLGVGRAI